MGIKFENTLDTPRTFSIKGSTFRWPVLQTPRLNLKNEPQYEITMALPENHEYTQQIVKQLEELYNENMQNVVAKYGKTDPKTGSKAPVPGANKPWKPDVDKEGVPTGYLLFKATSRAGGISKNTGKPWERRIKLFNSDLSPYDTEKQGMIGGGTKGNVSLEVTGYYAQGKAGIKLNLAGVQITKLVNAGKQSAQDFGFAAEQQAIDSDDTGSEYDPGN